MTTPLSIFLPKEGEKEFLRSFLNGNPVELGLYKNQVSPDGSMTLAALTEMITGGSRGYARKVMTKNMNEAAAAAAQWYLYINGSGRAEADYDVGPLTFSFNSYDVADNATVYGIFAITWVLPFDTGSQEIKVGNLIKGVTSGAYGVVTEVSLIYGSWGAGTAAGYIKVIGKTGIFQNNENLIIKGAIATGSIVEGGSGYAGGDIITVSQAGGSGAKLVVTDVDGYGSVVSCVVVDGGQGYSAATGLPTVALTGGGNGDFTFTISTLVTTACAVSNTGGNADAYQKLVGVWPFPTGVPVAVDGATIPVTVAFSAGFGS